MHTAHRTTASTRNSTATRTTMHSAFSTAHDTQLRASQVDAAPSRSLSSSRDSQSTTPRFP